MANPVIRRLNKLEALVRRIRVLKIDRILAAMARHMTADEVDAFAVAVERSLSEGEAAEYTEGEIAAMDAFNRMCAEQPRIRRLVAELEVGNGEIID